MSIRRRTYSSFNSMGMLSSGKYIVMYSKGVSGLPSPYNTENHYMIYNIEDNTINRFRIRDIIPLDLDIKSGVECNGLLYLLMSLSSAYIINLSSDAQIGVKIDSIVSNSYKNYYVSIVMDNNGNFIPKYGFIDPATGVIYSLVRVNLSSEVKVVTLDKDDYITQIVTTVKSNSNYGDFSSIAPLGSYDGKYYYRGYYGLMTLNLITGVFDQIANVELSNKKDWFIA